jgi:hypothetical protein
MRKILFLLSGIILSFSAAAQEVTKKLDLAQVTIVGNDLIVSGFKPMATTATFVAERCDRSLNVIKTYEKKLPDGIKSYYVAHSGLLDVFTFYGGNGKERYRIALDDEFVEKFAGEVVKTKNADKVPADDFTYEPGYNESYLYGDYMLDAQPKEITGYKLVDPAKQMYTEKWVLDLDAKEYMKVVLIGIDKNIAYYFGVNLRTNTQRFFGVNMAGGKITFETELNENDTLESVSVSNMTVVDDAIYLAGSYASKNPESKFRTYMMDDGTSPARGYRTLSPLALARSDGYYVMSVDPKSGVIKRMETFGYPYIGNTDKDLRRYKIAVCPGFAKFSNGKIAAVFEFLSTAFYPGFISNAAFGAYAEVNPKDVTWQTTAFANVTFSASLTDAKATTIKLDQPTGDWTLLDFDSYTIAPNRDVPLEFCTIGNEGSYPEILVSDGTSWALNIRSDDDEIADIVLRGTESGAMTTSKVNPPGASYLFSPGTVLQITEGENPTIKLIKL